jgi:hypothetical protein
MRRRRVSDEMSPGLGASAAFAKLKRELFHASHGTSTDTADDPAAALAASASASVTAAATAPFPASGQVVGEEFKGGRVCLPSRWSDSLSSSASEIPSPSVTPAGNSSDAHSSTSTVPPNTPSPVYAEASGSLHILVVDDSMAILKVTRRVLEHAGHQVSPPLLVVLSLLGVVLYHSHRATQLLRIPRTDVVTTVHLIIHPW